MNVEADPNPAGDAWPVRSRSTHGWSWKKTVFLIVLVFAAHLGFLFVFGAKKLPAPRKPSPVPQFQMAGNSFPELMALDDPTLFAVPHVQDFVPAIWRQLTNDISPAFHWPEPSTFLQPQPGYLGAAFNEFIQTNRFAKIQLRFKPQPRLAMPIVPAISLLPTTSTLHVTGELANRARFGSVNIPTLAENDVLAPSRVQVLVDTSGRVVSDVLLDSSGNGAADQKALDLARALQFAPANQLDFGKVIFHWHTVPKPDITNNTPAIHP